MDKCRLERSKKVRDELDNFSEQTEVIEAADNLIKSAKINEQRMNNGLSPLQNELYNMLFIGPPGSGKSTIAPLFAKLFKALGILKRDTSWKLIKVILNHLTPVTVRPK